MEHFADNYLANLLSLVVRLLLEVKGHTHPTSIESRDDAVTADRICEPNFWVYYLCRSIIPHVIEVHVIRYY